MLRSDYDCADFFLIRERLCDDCSSLLLNRVVFLLRQKPKSEGRRRFFQREKNGKRRRIVRAGFVAAAE